MYTPYKIFLNIFSPPSSIEPSELDTIYQSDHFTNQFNLALNPNKLGYIVPWSFLSRETCTKIFFFGKTLLKYLRDSYDKIFIWARDL